MEIELGPIGKMMEAKLQNALQPSYLQLVDESNQHHGHSGAHPSGESHYRVRISCDAFKGKSRVQQHQLVYDALKGQMGGALHALALQTGLPER